MGFAVAAVEDIPYTWGTFTFVRHHLRARPGPYVVVLPEAERRPAAGADRRSFLVVGGVPGGVYQPWELADE
ncbi:MAG TPA: hypothetical protein VHR46_08400 [Gaiella sp.]|nr:hypothetical protein [Gaiella sp.]